jgi:hypothetical protein
MKPEQALSRMSGPAGDVVRGIVEERTETAAQCVDRDSPFPHEASEFVVADHVPCHCFQLCGREQELGRECVR